MEAKALTTEYSALEEHKRIFDLDVAGYNAEVEAFKRTYQLDTNTDDVSGSPDAASVTLEQPWDQASVPSEASTDSSPDQSESAVTVEGTRKMTKELGAILTQGRYIEQRRQALDERSRELDAKSAAVSETGSAVEAEKLNKEYQALADQRSELELDVEVYKAAAANFKRKYDFDIDKESRTNPVDNNAGNQ